MAIETLFGPSIADVQELRRLQAEKEITGAGTEFGVFAPLYQAGLRFGGQAVQGVNTLLGAQDPMLKKATDIQGILTQYQDQDLTDPVVLKKISSDLAGKGYAAESLNLAKEAQQATTRQLSAQSVSQQIAESKARADKTAYAQQQDEKLRAELSALPDNASEEQILRVFRRYGSADQQTRAIQSSLDRRAKLAADARASQPEFNNNNVPMGRVDAKGNFYDNSGRKVLNSEFVDAEKSHTAAMDLQASLRQITEQDIDSAFGSVADYTKSTTGRLAGSYFSSSAQKAQYKINEVGVKTVLDNLQKLKGASTDKEMEKVASTFPGYQAKPEVMKAWVDNAIETTNRFLKRSEKRYGFDTNYEPENRFGTKKGKGPAAGEVPAASDGFRILNVQ